MDFEYDPAKDAANLARHGVSLRRAADLDVLAFVPSGPDAYGGVRVRAYGVLDGRGHVLVFTVRNGALRAISLRRAGSKEMQRHAR